MTRLWLKTPDITREAAGLHCSMVANGRSTWKRIARELGCSISYAKERCTALAGLKTQCHTVRTMTDDDIRGSWERCVDRTSTATAEAQRYGITTRTLKTVWCRLGLGHIPRCLGRKKKIIIATAELRRMYGAVASGSIELRNLSLQTGYSVQTLKRRWREHGMGNPVDELKERERLAMEGLK